MSSAVMSDVWWVVLWWVMCDERGTRRRADAEAEAARRVPSEKQEPHTVMWGTRSPVYCACHTKASRGPAGDHACSSSSRRLCVMHLPHESQPRARRDHARSSSSSSSCACHTNASCGPAGDHARSSSWLLQKALCTSPATICVLRLLHDSVVWLTSGVMSSAVMSEVWCDE